MTSEEAIEGAIERHEFHSTGYTVVGGMAGACSECWCGWKSPPFPQHEQARNAHARHQDRERKQR
jgi:hypothetical protein